MSQTALRAAPPRQKTTSAAVWMMIFGFVAMICFFNKAWVASAFLAFFAFLAFRAMQTVRTWNRTVFPGLWQAWNAAYLCMRCGTMAAPVMAMASAQGPQPINVTPATAISQPPEMIQPAPTMPGDSEK